MTKSLTRLKLAALAASLCALWASAQTPALAADTWVNVSPEGEGFFARMPKPPASVAERVRAGGLKASGRRYTAEGDGGATFVVWSLKDEDGAGRGPRAAGDAGEAVAADMSYLDQSAELAWELLVGPEIKRLMKDSPEWARAYAAMAYRREFNLGGLPARAYFLTLKETQGPVYVCADGARIYVVAALAAEGWSPQFAQFTNSFSLKQGAGGNLPGPSTLGGSGGAHGVTPIGPDSSNIPYGMIGSTPPPPRAPAGDAPVDYSKPFRHAEVTKKALITYKPEPGYTESARKFGVSGVVRMRAILSKTGEVTSITVVGRLPHGLTEKAVNAVRQVRFTPAQKDGREVSQYAVFEYIFNIY